MLMLLAASPAPTEDVRYPDPSIVTPGTIGFLAVFALAVVTIFLIRDALRRVRRVRAKDQAVDKYPIPMAKDQKRRYQPGTHTAEANDSFVSEEPPAGETGTVEPGAETPGNDTPRA